MRLINADALEKTLRDWIRDHWTEAFTGDDAGSEFADMIERAETIDADLAAPAHWIEHRANNGNMHYICSRCGKEVSYPYAKKRWKYCIECGAKMGRGGKRNMNKVVLMGRLTRDPDVRYTQGPEQKCIARYTLAVDRRKPKDSGGQQADFISCVAFGRAGEFVEKYCSKGTKLVVSGRIQTGSYTNRDGQKVYTTDVVVEDQEFAESKKDNSARDAMDDQAAQQYSGGEHEPAAGDAGNGFLNIPDGIEEELPFA